MNCFSGIWIPLITPFTSSGAVDAACLRTLVRELRKAEVAGFVALGTTGEPATLSDEEKQTVLDIVLDEAGAVPVVVGASGITADEVCDELTMWSALPLAGALITAPHYVRPSQQAIIRFFEDIAARTHLPIIVYDHPFRTGVHIELQTMHELARMPSVQAVKDCGGDARKTQALIADGRLAILAGEDTQVFTTIAQGGAGAITASAHLHPQLFVEMHRALWECRMDRAREIHHAVAPLVHALFSEPNPAPLKAVLEKLGRSPATVRKPHMRATFAAANEAWFAYETVTRWRAGKGRGD